MITIESMKLNQDTPDPLVLLCLKQIIRKPTNMSHYTLPSELGELIFAAFRDHALMNRHGADHCESFFKNFKHKYVPLNKIDVSGLPLTREFFINFLQEYKDLIDEINISGCPYLVYIDLKKLNDILKSSQRHKTLIIGDTIFKAIDERASKGLTENLFDDDLRLKKLVLHRMNWNAVDCDEFYINRHLSKFLRPTMSSYLKYLDLSMSCIGKGSALMQLESLEYLILFNCSMIYPDVISTLCQLKNIRVLDLSIQVVDSEDINLEPGDSKLLDTLVSRLPKLTYLDISGTNLIGGKDRTISAFESRMDRPFEFLGLFHTGNDAAYRSCIPAITIAGEATEAQMLNACQAYMDRPNQLSKALNDLYNFYKSITPSESFNDVNRALDVVLPILTRHLNDEHVIIYTTAALWCIVKINVTSRNLNDARIRRTITSRLLDVMHYHKNKRVILINGGLTLLFLPDIICEHSRVAAISLYMCRDSDPRTQGFGTTLLNSLACQVGGDEKIFIGNLKAIETMIDIIRSKIEEDTCDEILETAWSNLWNITDETPINCKRFLEFDGLKVFEMCMDKFGDNKEVLKSIMGLLGNVAECQKLRDSFMKLEYIRRFYSILPSHVDGIECSYNACGILAHLLSEGVEFWHKHEELINWRIDIKKAMREAIDKWPINSRRNINYRSFEPIVRLLNPWIDPEAQYWAVFALTNLTRINPTKYCPMLMAQDGLKKMLRLTEPNTTDSYVSNLARIAVYQCQRFEEEGGLFGLENSDSIELDVVRDYRAEPNDLTARDMGEIIL